MGENRNLISLLVVSVFLLTMLCAVVVAGTIYVDDDGLADFDNIQAAIDDSNDGDIIVVQPGIYTGDGNRDIEFKGKAITVRSENGAETCIIDCQGTPEESHRGFRFNGHEDANSVLQGFTVTNGYAAGGGIRCYVASPLITDCIITANSSYENGGGIACEGSGPTIVCCRISNNNSALFGGGISVIPHTNIYPLVTLINCTITGNNSGYGGGVYCHTSSVNLLNCTVSGNRASDWGGGFLFWRGLGGNINNSILYGNMAPSGNDLCTRYSPGHAGCPWHPLHNISHSVVGDDPNAIVNLGCPDLISGQWIQVDPLFADPGYWDPNGTPDEPNDDFWVDGDYHLKSQAGRWDPNSQSWVQDDVTSPCIDAGDMSSPIGLEPFPNGGIINMGAYGGTAEASKSYLGEPVCETIVAGDINGDCKVDFKDFELMASHWLDENH